MEGSSRLLQPLPGCFLELSGGLMMSVWLQCLSQRLLSPEPVPRSIAAAPCWRPVSAASESAAFGGKLSVAA